MIGASVGVGVVVRSIPSGVLAILTYEERDKELDEGDEYIRVRIVVRVGVGGTTAIVTSAVVVALSQRVSVVTLVRAVRTERDV